MKVMSFGDSYKTAADKKANRELERINRPLIPICARIYLKNKAGDKADVPEAVGSVRVNWIMTDANEDLTTLPSNTAAEPSETNKYVEKTLNSKMAVQGQTAIIATKILVAFEKRPRPIGKPWGC